MPPLLLPLHLSPAPPTSPDNNKKDKCLPKGGKHMSLNTGMEAFMARHTVVSAEVQSWPCLTPPLPERSLSEDSKGMMFVIMLEKQNSPRAVTSLGSAEPKPLLTVGANSQLHVLEWKGTGTLETQPPQRMTALLSWPWPTVGPRGDDVHYVMGRYLGFSWMLKAILDPDAIFN